MDVIDVLTRLKDAGTTVIAMAVVVYIWQDSKKEKREKEKTIERKDEILLKISTDALDTVVKNTNAIQQLGKAVELNTEVARRTNEELRLNSSIIARVDGFLNNHNSSNERSPADFKSN